MNKLLLSILMATLTHLGWSQCTAMFTDTALNSSTFLFTSTSTGLNPSSTQFFWNCNGGTPQQVIGFNQTSASIEYTSPGDYEVCLSVTDTASWCTNWYCDSIHIPGSGFYTKTYPHDDYCGNCDGRIIVKAFGGETPYTYLWSNGNTGFGNTNLCAGVYTVTIVDNSNDTVITSDTVKLKELDPMIAGDTIGCIGDSMLLSATSNAEAHSPQYLWSTGETTENIWVSTSGYYSVTITHSTLCPAGSDTMQFTFGNTLPFSLNGMDETCQSCCDGSATAISSVSNISHSWNTGDTTANIFNLCPGTYAVTISKNNNSCSGVDSITIDSFGFGCYYIAGEIDQGEHTRVYLIQEDNGVLTAVDSTQTDTGGLYVFSNVCSGTYYVKGALLPAHVDYSNYIPTYYDSVALWGAATPITVNNANVFSVDFSLIQGTNNGGAGFVGGFINQGANRGEGDPVEGAWVIAYDEDGRVSGFDKSDANGAYTIENLSLGTYSVYVDILNKTPYPHEFTLT